LFNVLSDACPNANEINACDSRAIPIAADLLRGNGRAVHLHAAAGVPFRSAPSVAGQRIAGRAS